MHNNIFMNKYKKHNIGKNCTNFLKKIEKFKLFLVKFNKINIIRSKVYFFNYIIKIKDY